MVKQVTLNTQKDTLIQSTNSDSQLHQDMMSIQKNSGFFNENDAYIHNQERLEIYRLIRLTVEREVTGAKNLLDIGNGGFFNYKLDNIEHVIACDLMLKDGMAIAPNVVFRQGSILDLPFENDSFDVVLEQNVFHHVTGATVQQNRELLTKAIQECARVLAPNGKLVIVESIVPAWFYTLIEYPLYRILTKFWSFSHPLTFQYTQQIISEELKKASLQTIEHVLIPRGDKVIQFGVVIPTMFTPIQAVKYVAVKQ